MIHGTHRSVVEIRGKDSPRMATPIPHQPGIQQQGRPTPSPLLTASSRSSRSRRSRFVRTRLKHGRRFPCFSGPSQSSYSVVESGRSSDGRRSRTNDATGCSTAWTPNSRRRGRRCPRLVRSPGKLPFPCKVWQRGTCRRSPNSKSAFGLPLVIGTLPVRASP